jgi:hypothetical protein
MQQSQAARARVDVKYFCIRKAIKFAGTKVRYKSFVPASLEGKRRGELNIKKKDQDETILEHSTNRMEHIDNKYDKELLYNTPHPVSYVILLIMHIRCT